MDDYTVSTTVWITTQFHQLHRWKDAPEQRSYLRNLHRHLFKVRVAVDVRHDDREVEYHDLQQAVDSMIAGMQTAWHENNSCESIAKFILEYTIRWFPDRSFYEVEVSEDGENGSTVAALAK